MSRGRRRGGPQKYRLVVAGPADRRISEKLPESVAAPVAEFIVGDLIATPRRVGRQLGPPLEGVWSARRGAYRILYEIDEETRTVTVLDVAHRANIYRGPRPRRR